MTQSNQSQNSPAEQPKNKQPQDEQTQDEQTKDASSAVDPRDLVYNEGTVDNPEELLSRPNVTPQTLADNDRAM
ncbi:MAG: hypothetical protein ACFB5Z_13395 [Elainellaceae cyanobacterium]